MINTSILLFVTIYLVTVNGSNVPIVQEDDNVDGSSTNNGLRSSSIVHQLQDVDTIAPLHNRRRNLICFGIFRDCNDDGEDNESSNNSTDENGGDGSISLNDSNFCLGLFRTCNETDSTSNTQVDCSNATNGIFGGQPLFGRCGSITEYLFGTDNGIVNGTDTDNDGVRDTFYFESNSSDKGPFGFGLLPESGFLYEVFNTEDNKTILEALVDIFDAGTDSFAFGFIEDWSDSAVTTNDTCTNNNDTEVPACYDATGNDGFWVCRTLADPFTAELSSKTICISQGAFLDGNDICGCCPSSDGTNSTTTEPSCPRQCPCVCDRNGETGNGVWITTNSTLEWGDTKNATIVQTCVDPKWAVSATTGFRSITCVEDCSTITE